MNPIERLNQKFNEGLDDVLNDIKYGRIKCGKYAHLVHIDKKAKLPKGELIINGEGKRSKKP